MRNMWVMALLAAMQILGGAGTAVSKGNMNLQVVVSILPQAYFVERIGGRHVIVDVLVGPGQSPATYEPTPQQMAMLASADIYFRIGVPFERALMGKVPSSFPRLRMVDTRHGVLLRFFDHDHHSAEVSHRPRQAPDPHIWLDPKRVKIQAGTICEALKDKVPMRAAVFEANLERFLAELDAIDDDISRILSPVHGKDIFVFHPAFGYFCDSYGLNQIALEVAGKEPTGKHIAALIDMARQRGADVIFVEPQFSRKVAEAVARAIGGRIEILDPLPRNWADNIRHMALTIRQALEKQ